MFSAEQNCWFVRKVVCWRAAASIAWAVLLLPPVTALFVVLSRVSLFHPIEWITECLSILTSASTMFSFVLLCGVVVVVGFFNLEYYTVTPSIACSKIALLAQLLHPRQCLHAVVHCIMGVIVAWCCAFTIGPRYQNLAAVCTLVDGDPQLCLNEYHLVLILFGAFVGYSHSLFGVMHNMNYVPFHAVQQYKYLRFKGNLPLVVKCSAIQSLYFTRNFLAVYFFLGYIPRSWLCDTLSLQSNSSLNPLDSIAGLLDLAMLYHLWISGTFLLLTWYLTVLLFRVFVTEVYNFPVQSAFTEQADRCLPKVLPGQQPMVLKFLALQDLALLSQHSPSRRAQVFSLSQPGGHPHNWNALSSECLSLLADLTQRLVAHHETVAINGRAKLHSAGSDKKSVSSDSSGLSATQDISTPRSAFLRSAGTAAPMSPNTGPFTSDLDSPFSSRALRRLAPHLVPSSPWSETVQSPHLLRRGPQLWSASTDTGTSGSLSPSPTSAPCPHPAEPKPSPVTQFLHNRKEQVKHFLGRRVLVMYLFNKLPEASSQALFADSQSHIWALEGLSHLVAASFTEDKFGVVQTTLPSILGSMLVLQEAVDRHFKLPHASSKPLRSACSMGDCTSKTLRFALRATLKTAIYRITTTFGHHLNAIKMSAEHRKRLQQFLEYKE
ncbi:nucleoporin NDC1 [Gadus chalcogrammus]|uniref:nucleoporin NDC1 n=1 Tax=Gadus chalcogrammus TaxID=1042646 RepID=UPI0024C4AEB2|nr:nucleoporin NDC1 [Gadus chalcogrammus]